MDTILLVNDSTTLTKVLTSHFQQAGYRVIAVTGAMDAYEAFIRNDVHLILTDYVLRDKDGFQVIETFRTKKSMNGGALPIVVFTAIDDELDETDDTLTITFDDDVPSAVFVHGGRLGEPGVNRNTVR